jgi:hypothetical protein
MISKRFSLSRFRKEANKGGSQNRLGANLLQPQDLNNSTSTTSPWREEKRPYTLVVLPFTQRFGTSNMSDPDLS